MILLRKAIPEDSEAAAKIQVDSYRTAYAHILPEEYLAHFTYEEQTQDWRDLIGSEAGEFLLVAEFSDTVIGYVLGRIGLTDDGHDAELVALHIQEKHRRKGIGRKIMDAAVAEMKRLGCTSMSLWVLEDNLPARAFYESLGGKLIGKKAWGNNAYFGTSIHEVTYGWSTFEDLGLRCSE